MLMLQSWDAQILCTITNGSTDYTKAYGFINTLLMNSVIHHGDNGFSH